MLFKALDGKMLQYPVALDIEDRNTASIGKDKLTALVKRGLDIIDQRGYKPMLYTYTNYKCKAVKQWAGSVTVDCRA